MVVKDLEPYSLVCVCLDAPTPQMARPASRAVRLHIDAIHRLPSWDDFPVARLKLRHHFMLLTFIFRRENPHYAHVLSY